MAFMAPLRSLCDLGEGLAKVGSSVWASSSKGRWKHHVSQRQPAVPLLAIPTAGLENPGHEPQGRGGTQEV